MKYDNVEVRFADYLAPFIGIVRTQDTQKKAILRKLFKLSYKYDISYSRFLDLVDELLNWEEYYD